MIYRWKTILRTGIPLLSLCVCIEIFAGQILQSNQDTLILFPLLLISIPVINSVGGNIGSILGSRLASGLHIGSIELSIYDKTMHKNFIVTLGIGLITYGLLGVIIYYIANVGNVEMNIGLYSFVSIILATGILLIIVIAIMSVVTAFVSFQKGLDPDDMVAPVVTTAGDTFGILFLFFIIGVVGI